MPVGSGIEYQLCDATCQETELYQSIDAFPRFDSVLVKRSVAWHLEKQSQSTIVADSIELSDIGQESSQ